MKRLFALVFVGWHSLALATPATLYETRLENGMQIIVKQDTRAPIVVHQVWYRVGANYEPSGLTGISHMLEHMMFKGTEQLAPGEFSRRVSTFGGQENAFTSSDYTAYYQVVGKSHLAEVMRMEADRMANLRLSEQTFEPERNVVKQERLWSIEDRPGARLYEQFNATAYLNSPERNPVIGWMTDIENYRLEDLADWYQQWYAPNNATLVVVGDVKPKDVVALAQQTYGQYPPRTVNPPKPQFEMTQQGECRIELKDATPIPSLLMGFHTPSLVNATDKQEVYALAVLASILDGDDSARLNQRLVRNAQVASQVGASYSAFGRLGGQFIVSGQPAQGKTAAQLEAALLAQIEQLQQQLISDDELQRVLAQAEAQHVYQQDSVQAQANMIGMMVSVGLAADTAQTWVAHLRQVTPQQVQAVAQKYLRRDNLTVALLSPNGETNRKPVAKPNFSGRTH